MSNSSRADGYCASMSYGLWMVAAGWLGMAPIGGPEREVVYRFDTADYRIEMTVGFYPPYLGRRLSFHNSTEPDKEQCYSGNGASGSCVAQFVGAVAVVTYRFQPRRGVAPAATFRENVTVVAQSAGLAVRAAYRREQQLVRGVGSDIQSFGYDEAEVAQPARAATRTEWRRLWRVYHQELFVNSDSEPFAVVEWKHTVDRIELIRTVGSGIFAHSVPACGFSNDAEQHCD
jgi:hypothetical protein